jgi:hypothetical protein
MQSIDVPSATSLLMPPLVTREVFAASIGLPVDVVRRQCDRGYWPCVTVGKYSLVNVEAIRVQAAERGREFSL